MQPDQTAGRRPWKKESATTVLPHSKGLRNLKAIDNGQYVCAIDKVLVDYLENRLVA